jgi:hypothetical protein
MNLRIHPLTAITAMVLATAAGCGSVNHDSFAEFSDSMQELRDGADEALRIPGEWSRERYVLESTAASADTVEGLDAVQWLILERDAESVYAWSMVDEPLYVTQKRFRRGVYELNDALAGYAVLLGDLANAGPSATEFDERARALNDGIRGSAAAMGDSATAGDVAIFSTAATELIHRYLDGKKREHLAAALAENQSTVEMTAEHVRSALRLTALQLWHEYDEEAFAIAGSLDPYSPVKLRDRQKRVGGIVDANDVLTEQLEVLRLLDESYAALPGANRELYESLDNPGWSLSAIRQIADNGIRLRRLYEDLDDD